ncbi:MAG TPA: acyl-CoA dehydrogenase family protein [bacterium]|nr:acyl-CoA dehydrogenase family protein [bacterium]
MKALTHLDVAKRHLPMIGRLMVRKRYGDFWEEETRTLPWPFGGLRRKYKAFADEYIRPRALGVDQDVSALDKEWLFTEYARRGWASELLPWPIGGMKVAALRSYGLHAALKMEELCAACGGIALMLGAHDLGMAPLLMSGDLKVLWDWTIPIYKRLNKGERAVWAFAITEPGAGSDVEETEGALKARVVTRAKRAEGGYVLNGRKVFISDGGIADYVTVFACLGDEGVESWTCFVVESGMKGFTKGRREKKMGQKAGDATELIFEDVFVPDRNRVGPERSGWALNRNVLNFSRPVVGAIALGIARGAFEHCLEFCQNTRQGPRRLVEYQEVQLALAEMMIRLMAGRSLIWHAGRFMPPLPLTSAAAKVFCSDTAVTVCASAMDIMGDHAYMHGNYVEKALRDARLTQIYEGTNQINRLGIIEDMWEHELREV